MTVYEMEGFLRGKCLPGDMKVNESNAQYLVRKFSELQSQNADMAVQLANAESKCRELAAENSAIKVMNDCLSEEMRGYESDGAFEGPKMHLLWWKTETPVTEAFLAEVRAQESKRVYESILDNPAVTDMASLVDWLEQYANDSVAFAAQLRKGDKS
ncbi:hypothetical protein HV030_19915 [Citrobacter freundii]|nr:hypothetical protein [Citrobacter freundii]QMA48691.1 hypothetical protein HV030_19915 [Citrobacter freundii]